MNPITVLLAEDHNVVREGLKSLLNLEPDIRVIGEAENGRVAVRLALELRPDVVVMDIGMPLLNGLEAARQILRQRPETRILVLSAHDDPAYVEQVMTLGAAGYLLKLSSGKALSEAIREVSSGNTYLPCSTTRLPRHPSTPPVHRATLTSRECEVLQLIAEGKANKQVASELGISIKTVEKHRQSLMEKVGIHDTAGLTRHAIATGVIQGRNPGT